MNDLINQAPVQVRPRFQYCDGRRVLPDPNRYHRTATVPSNYPANLLAKRIMKVSLIFTVRSALAFLIIAGALAACDVESFDDAVAKIDSNSPQPPPPPPPPPPPTFAANFSEIQANVFTPGCATSGCHIGGGAPEGLRLDEANSYALLVGVASTQDPGVQLVAPGNPHHRWTNRLSISSGSGSPTAPSTTGYRRRFLSA